MKVSFLILALTVLSLADFSEAAHKNCKKCSGSSNSNFFYFFDWKIFVNISGANGFFPFLNSGDDCSCDDEVPDEPHPEAPTKPPTTKMPENPTTIAPETTHVKKWGYDEDPEYYGPADWGKYDAKCDGMRQSPIDIVSASASAVDMSNPIRFSGYDDNFSSAVFKNDGHGFAVTTSDAILPNITGGPLGSDVYSFVNFHMHWPSEHTLNGQSYTAEVHIVHYNTKYGSFAAAAGQSDGLAVIGVFLDNSESADAARSVFDAAEMVKEYGSANYIDAMPSYSLSFFVDYKGDSAYYSYLGSLTVPTCNEAVTWIVKNEPIQIHPEEFAILMSIEDDHGHLIDNNNRPVQPLNGRSISGYVGL